jgi:hypothetical protein
MCPHTNTYNILKFKIVKKKKLSECSGFLLNRVLYIAEKNVLGAKCEYTPTAHKIVSVLSLKNNKLIL